MGLGRPLPRIFLIDDLANFGWLIAVLLLFFCDVGKVMPQLSPFAFSKFSQMPNQLLSELLVFGFFARQIKLVS